MLHLRRVEVTLMTEKKEEKKKIMICRLMMLEWELQK